MSDTLQKGRLIELIDQKQELSKQHDLALQIICSKVSTTKAKALWDVDNDTEGFAYVNIADAKVAIDDLENIQKELKKCEIELTDTVTTYNLQELYKRLSA